HQSQLPFSSEGAYFNWEEYLEETGATAAPHSAFKHVEISLQSSFQPGMKLEVANKSSPDTYWVATIITTCGQLLLLRFSGYGDDRKADFWCDVMTAELHPVGWCAQNNKTLQPPEAIKEKYTDWTDFLIQDLTGSRTTPANLLEGPLRGKNTVDLIVGGSMMEVRDLTDPSLYWAVRVIQNIGGRLCLRYVGLHDDDAHDIWLFYLDVRLRPLGWAQENCLELRPPGELHGQKSANEWHDALEAAWSEARRNPLPLEVFKDHADLTKHSFSAGMKLEMVSPWEPLHICPVSVTQVYNEHYFQVTVDDLSPEPKPLSLVCHAESLGILPVQWCLKNGIGLQRPRGCLSQDFDWADYLKQSGTEAAPDACFPGVLSMLINAAYKPGRVLRELQEVEDQQWDCHEETLKAKYKGKTYRSSIRIVRLAEQIPDFCRKVCAKLQCCPNLFSPVQVTDKCPENCSIQTKTKYTYYYGKKRKLSKPCGAEESLEATPTRRRKKRKAIFVQKKRRSSTVDLTPAGSPQNSDEDDDEDYLMMQSGSEEGTGSEPRDDRTDTSSVETGSTRPRRAVTLRRATHTGIVECGEEEGRLVLERNPLEWSVQDVVTFITSTDCAALASIFQEQDIDGQALLLLTLPTVQECMELKLGPAIKLCHQIERVKVAFYAQYAN
uniref:SAM domain-containing protein n=1 Tax=Esox lucius TaxID=8010 RepID=A0AAY5KN38_ESOLU